MKEWGVAFFSPAGGDEDGRLDFDKNVNQPVDGFRFYAGKIHGEKPGRLRRRRNGIQPGLNGRCLAKFVIFVIDNFYLFVV